MPVKMCNSFFFPSGFFYGHNLVASTSLVETVCTT